MELRNERLSTLQRVEALIKEKSHTRSANLDNLLHQGRPDATPMDKAMSHSGPCTFGNRLLEQSDRGAHK